MIKELKNKAESSSDNKLFDFQFSENLKLQIYPASLNDLDGELFFIAKEYGEKYLFIISRGNKKNNYIRFDGIEINSRVENLILKKCQLNTQNRKYIQQLFEFTKPVTIGLHNSFGFGDRIGLANAGHLRSLGKSNFKPILAQQSIRELTRTNRTADKVMDAAVWAVFQEGYKKGFGADADHLKTEDDITLMMTAGYKMLTFDPSAFVNNDADNYSQSELKKIVDDFNWINFGSSFEGLKKEYLTETKIDKELSLKPAEINLMRALVKYGDALIHIKNLYSYLKKNFAGDNYEVEISVDETDSVTSTFEHFFIAKELKRLKIDFISLALRFVGDFEKGIDYKGDLNLFKREYINHLKIVKYIGNYKISLHSGSDKFSVYKVIGSLKDASTHVKTAGTSYLEALKVTALKEPDLFRKILDFSRDLYEEEKKTYHVSAVIGKVKDSCSYNNEELLELFNLDDARQVLHVTFGRVLTEKDSAGNHLFKQKIINCLNQNEELHYKILIRHFNKHLKPFNL
jgi:hypothetical protein